MSNKIGIRARLISTDLDQPWSKMLRNRCVKPKIFVTTLAAIVREGGVVLEGCHDFFFG